MRTRVIALLTGLALLLPLLSSEPATATASQAAGPRRPVPADPPIRFEAYTFSPQRGERPDTPPGLTVSRYAQGQAGLYLVQFDGPVRSAWKGEVEAAGGRLLGYVPEYAFEVRMTPAVAQRVERLESVAWVGILQPAFKLPPGLDRDDPPGVLRATVLDDSDPEVVRVELEAAGVDVLGGGGRHLLVFAGGDDLEMVAHHLGIEVVERFFPPQTHNEYGAGQIVGGAIANASGFDGSGEIVAVADTGLGGGSAATAHPDIPATRVASIFNWPGSAGGCFTSIVDDGPRDVDSGHGTHVAGSILSDGNASGVGVGSAPAADLLFQAVENYATVHSQCKTFYGIDDGYYLVGLPTDLTALFQQAYDAGARVHANSWGVPNTSACLSDYTADAVTADAFVRTHRDLTITFSAGNDGIDGDGDGSVDTCSLAEPATAKNIITVGASENDRQGNWDCDLALAYTTCADDGGQNAIFTYGSLWPSSYPANPIAGDQSAGNAEQLAAFSSRGPTTDGRVKPDVVAPGTWILSGYSDLYQQGYDASLNPQNGAWQYDGWGFPYSAVYKYMGGTSMSNPIVAGGAAVVRDFYETTAGHSPSAALVKATLIQSAVDIADENNDGSDDNGIPIPNPHEGWGRIDLAAATAGGATWFDEPALADAEHDAAALETGENFTRPFTVAAGKPLKVTLVWTDHEATGSAAVDLVNDLDLTVTAPDGTTAYRGNQFSDGWSVTGGSYDGVNNVENVYVEAPVAGQWTVSVDAANVPNGPQPFALVVDHGNDIAPTVTVDNPPDGATGVSGTVVVQIGASDVEDPAGTLTTQWQVDGGAWQAATWNPSSGSYESSWDSTTVVDGTHTIAARVVDSASNESTATSTFGVRNGRAIADLDGDGDTDRAVWRPSNGGWYVNGQSAVWWGRPDDVPVLGDFDGDRATDRAVWRPSNGGWYLQDGATVFLGQSGDVPVPGDYDGDGSTDRAVWRPSTGAWIIEGQPTRFLGSSGDVPVPGDYDGDGAVEPAVWRPSTGGWHVQGQPTVNWGLSGDVPVPGDFDGDGSTDRAVWRPSTGGWYVQGQPTVNWGLSADVPAPGDYDGDGSTDRAVWRPGAGGGWHVHGQAPSVYWGRSGDVALPLAAAIQMRFFCPLKATGC